MRKNYSFLLLAVWERTFQEFNQNLETWGELFLATPRKVDSGEVNNHKNCLFSDITISLLGFLEASMPS